MGNVDAGVVAHIVDGPWWARDLLYWRRDVRAIRGGAVAALHEDDRAWLDSFVAGTPRPRGTADVEACVAERGLGPVRATFDPRLARAAEDEDARAEGLYRLGKALLDVNEAFWDWPRPTDPSADYYTPTRDESPLERLGRAILADTLARATRLYAWNEWVVRAEALLARNWPGEWSDRGETRGAASGWEIAGPAAR